MTNSQSLRKCNLEKCTDEAKKFPVTELGAFVPKPSAQVQ